MAFEHFTLPVPSEMQSYDGLWDLPEDHISIHSQEGHQLGFVRTSWTEQGRCVRETAVTLPSPSPEDTLHLTPLINHSSTWKFNSPAPSPSPPSPPGPTANTLAIIGNTRVLSDQSSLESFVTDRWVNSQSSRIDGSRYGRSRTPSLDHGRTSKSQLTLEPDSAATSFSTLPPQTPPPPSFHAGSHFGSQLAGFTTPSKSPLTIAREKRSRASDDSDTTIYDDTQDPNHLGVEVELRTPEPLLAPAKKARWNSTPAYPLIPGPLLTSTSQTSTKAAETKRDGGGEGDGPGTPLSVGSTPHVLVYTGLIADADPLDVLAMAAAMRSSVEVEDSGDTGAGWQDLKFTEHEQVIQDGGNQVDDKRWLLDQLETSPVASTEISRIPSLPFAVPDILDLLTQPAHVIPSNVLPRTTKFSPAKSIASSDLTAESEATPTIDSRTRRLREREARKLAKLVPDEELSEEEEEFTPGPRGRARSVGLQLKQRFIDGEILASGETLKDKMEMARGLLAFGSRARREDTAEDDSTRGLPSTSMTFGSLAAIAEEPVLRSVNPAGPLDQPYGGGKSVGKATAAVLPRRRNLSGFIAPTPLKRDTPSLPDVSQPGATPKGAGLQKSRKRKVNDDKEDLLGEAQDEKRLPGKKVKPNTLNTSPAGPKSRIPPELLNQPVIFTSISEAAKLRRSNKAAMDLAQATAGSTSTTPTIAAKTPGKSTTKKTTSVKEVVVPATRVHNTRAASGSPGRGSRSRRAAKKIIKEESESEEEQETAEEEEGEGEEDNEEKEEEDEEEEKKSKKKKKSKGGEKATKRGKDRIYAEAEKDIMLEAWDGVQPLTKQRLRECAATIDKAGYGVRTPEALKWYMKNTLWPRYAERYGRSKKRDLSGWRTASDESGSSAQRK